MLMCIKAQAVTRLSLSNKKCNCFSSSVSNVTQMRGWRDLGTAGRDLALGWGWDHWPLDPGTGGVLRFGLTETMAPWVHSTPAQLAALTSPAASTLALQMSPHLQIIIFHISMFPQFFKYHYPTHSNCKVKLALHNCGSFAQQLDRINGTTPYSSSS